MRKLDGGIVLMLGAAPTLNACGSLTRRKPSTTWMRRTTVIRWEVSSGKPRESGVNREGIVEACNDRTPFMSVFSTPGEHNWYFRWIKSWCRRYKGYDTDSYGGHFKLGPV